MGININSNISSLQTDRRISNSTKKLNDNFSQLASGKRINKAADDPAGLAIAMAMLQEADTSVVAARNVNDGVSAATIAEGAIESSTQIVGRLGELSAQASNATLSSDQRAALNAEYQQLTAELDRIAQTTEFNGQSLLASDSSIDLQVGTDGSAASQIALGLPGVSASSLGLAADISTVENAKQALDQSKSATGTLAEARGEIGATVSRLDTTLQNLKVAEVGQREAASRIQDLDVAKGTADLTKNRIQQQAGVAIKAQANILPQLALRLLG